MAKGEDLGMKHDSASKTSPERRKQRENDREHRIRKLLAGRAKCNRVNQNAVFGRDTLFHLLQHLQSLPLSHAQLHPLRFHPASHLRMKPDIPTLHKPDILILPRQPNS